MKKIETTWHYLLNSALTERKFKHTQQELAVQFGYSLSTINHALKGPTQIGAVRKASKFFVLEDFQKLLYFWASLRNLGKDIIYKTYVDESVNQIEGEVPPQAVYAAYSAGRKILGLAPADYSKVYVCLKENDLGEIKRRFPPLGKKGVESNLFVIKEPEIMNPGDGYTTLPQTFVDLWNLSDWYAKDFTKALEEKIYGILS